MNIELIDKYITLPMAINVMNQDRENFKNFKMESVYKWIQSLKSIARLL